MKWLETWDWPQIWYLGPSKMALSIPLVSVISGAHQAASHLTQWKVPLTGAFPKWNSEMKHQTDLNVF